MGFALLLSRDALPAVPTDDDSSEFGISLSFVSCSRTWRLSAASLLTVRSIHDADPHLAHVTRPALVVPFPQRSHRFMIPADATGAPSCGTVRTMVNRHSARDIKTHSSRTHLGARQDGVGKIQSTHGCIIGRIASDTITFLWPNGQRRKRRTTTVFARFTVSTTRSARTPLAFFDGWRPDRSFAWSVRVGGTCSTH